MDVRIASKRATVSDADMERARTRVRRLEKYEPRLLTVDVLFDEDHGESTVEVRADVPGLPPLVTRCEASSHRTALDRAMERMSRRLRKERSKRTEHQSPPAGATLEE
jgi:ribosomal subunit interface protein